MCSLRFAKLSRSTACYVGCLLLLLLCSLCVVQAISPFGNAQFQSSASTPMGRRLRPHVAMYHLVDMFPQHRIFDIFISESTLPAGYFTRACTPSAFSPNEHAKCRSLAWATGSALHGGKTFTSNHISAPNQYYDKIASTFLKASQQVKSLMSQLATTPTSAVVTRHMCKLAKMRMPKAWLFGNVWK